MKILFLSHTPAGGDFVVGSHHLAKAYSDAGHEVVHLSPPVTPAHLFRCRKRFERIRVQRWWNSGERIHQFWDVIPGSLIPWGVARRISNIPDQYFVNACERSSTKILKKYDFESPELVLIDEPRLARLVTRFSSSRVVYRPTDLYSAIRDDASLIVPERFLAEHADRFVATSQPVADHLRALGCQDVLVVENGVDLDVFTRPSRAKDDVLKSNRPKVVYAGALDKRFGVEALLASSQRCPMADFLLAGPCEPKVADALNGCSNVSLLGPVPFAKLPELFSECRLALLPLSDDPSNNGRSPMKIFEYAAAGLPIVATRTDELARRALGCVALANNDKHFSELVSDILDERLTLENGTQLAQAHSWSAKADRILNYAMG